ncbi:hypothetical protein KASHIRA_01490 [Serratia phage vB_SmaM-Kashira]|nr:hypothetical protein [Acinetobacter phage ABPH49]URC22723.1 hypothetical protein KASHIRA_01490 [Serratia phage vB_SmaM-Kashira]
MFDKQMAQLHSDAMKLRSLMDDLLIRSAEDVDFFDEYEGV